MKLEKVVNSMDEWNFIIFQPIGSIQIDGDMEAT